MAQAVPNCRSGRSTAGAGSGNRCAVVGAVREANRVETDDVGDEILVEQIDYYRARAPEYDRWFRREGRYDRGVEATSRWFAEVAELMAALDELPLDGAAILELAPGTGIWTERLVVRSADVTAVDSSPEMIEHNVQRLGDRAERVRYIEADLFDWVPDRVYDGVVFCFWISHVPDERLDGFLSTVAAALRPGGWFFFVDGLREDTSTAMDHVLPEAGVAVMTRRLDDGREFRIVKNYWTLDELTRRTRAAGLVVDVRETLTYFQYGAGTRIQ